MSAGLQLCVPCDSETLLKYIGGALGVFETLKLHRFLESVLEQAKTHMSGAELALFSDIVDPTVSTPTLMARYGLTEEAVLEHRRVARQQLAAARDALNDDLDRDGRGDLGGSVQS